MTNYKKLSLVVLVDTDDIHKLGKLPEIIATLQTAMDTIKAHHDHVTLASENYRPKLDKNKPSHHETKPGLSEAERAALSTKTDEGTGSIGIDETAPPNPVIAEISALTTNAGKRTVKPAAHSSGDDAA